MLKSVLVLHFSLLSFVVNAEEIHVGVVYPSLAAVNEIVRLFEKSSSDKIIVHQAVLLKRAENNAAAKNFFNYRSYAVKN